MSESVSRASGIGNPRGESARCARPRAGISDKTRRDEKWMYDVLRHGFRVNKAGYYKLNCTLQLLPYVTNRYNIAMQFGRKPASLPHVSSTTSSTGGIDRPSATEANFTLIGVPVATGYVNLHSSNTKPNESKHIDHIVYLDVGDEVALFTTGIGVYGPNTELFALTEFCSFQIHSM